MLDQVDRIAAERAGQEPGGGGERMKRSSSKAAWSPSARPATCLPSSASSSPTRSARRSSPASPAPVLLDCAATLGIEVDERDFLEEEAIRGSELFITSTTREVSWVARWNDRYISQARCGPSTLALHKELRRRVVAETK